MFVRAGSKRVMAGRIMRTSPNGEVFGRVPSGASLAEKNRPKMTRVRPVRSSKIG